METFHCSILGEDVAVLRRGMWRKATALTVSRVTKPKPQTITGHYRMPPVSTGIAVVNQQNPPPGSSAVDRAILQGLLREKELAELAARGGTEGIAASLETYLECGITGDSEDISRRVRDFGTNWYVNPTPPRNFFHFVWKCFGDPIILMFVICAALLLGFGIEKQGLREGWYDGGSLFVAVFLVVSVSAFGNFKQHRQFDKAYHMINIKIPVVRNGRRQLVSKFEIVVGDVVVLNIGGRVPAGGLLIDGFSLQIDESILRGGSSNVRVNRDSNPFLFSGSVVDDGFGTMLVISVGMNTSGPEMTGADLDEQTPVDAQLDKITSSARIAGFATAFLVLVVTLVRFFTGNTEDDHGNREFDESKAKADGVIYSVVGNIAYVAVIVNFAILARLGLLVLRHTFAYSMKRMIGDMAMVRKLSACEVMGSATTICTDKTGTLTLNEMKVTKFWIGKEAMVGRHFTLIPRNVLELLRQGVGLNTTDTPTENAILDWGKLELHMDIEAIKRDCNVLQVQAFNSERKKSGIQIKKVEDGTSHVHWKGGAEKILAMCSHYYDAEGNRKALNDHDKKEFDEIIQGMAASSLRCIAFAHGQVLEARQNDIQENGLTLLGLVGLKNPCRPHVTEAVQDCQGACVNVKMITGDDVLTAKAIATECGILQQRNDDGLVVEGEEFRNYTEDERMEKVGRICVMARSSPSDKRLMVQCLRRMGHVVAVTGDRTNDAPALHESDIGLAMGIQGTEVAKESSDIVILDDNFPSIATVIRWGRCVHIAIQKFIQFQLTVFVATLTISLVSAGATGKAPLTPAQLLWVSLIMATLVALALATEKPTKELMQKPPVGLSEPLISNIILRNIAGQSLYQTAVILALMFWGKSVFGNETDTLLFTTFMLLQVVNLFNVREIEEKNVFKGILGNKLFIGIAGIIIVLQVAMVELKFLNKLSHTGKLNWKEWGVSAGLAALSWVIGVLIKFLPVPNRSVQSLTVSYLGRNWIFRWCIRQ